jgi:hypothetical protein
VNTGSRNTNFRSCGTSGQKILREKLVEPPLAIHVVHNWFEEFRRRPQE